MSFFFPSFWDDQDDFFEPYSTLSQFLGDLNEQRMERQKAQLQQQRRQQYYRKPQMKEEEEEEDEDEVMSDGEVVEAHQKREEKKEQQKEKAKEEEKKAAEEIARLEKDLVTVPASDVVEDDTHFIITMDMPGVKREGIHVSLENDILSVSAERPQPCADAKTVLHREISHGKIERQFEVPKDTKPEDIFAKVQDGVLTLTIKKPVVEAPRNISIA